MNLKGLKSVNQEENTEDEDFTKVERKICFITL